MYGNKYFKEIIYCLKYSQIRIYYFYFVFNVMRIIFLGDPASFSSLSDTQHTHANTIITKKEYPVKSLCIMQHIRNKHD